MDKIKIVNLEIYAGHGVLADETRNGQLFVINAELMLNLQPAGKADDLILSTHYGEVCQFMNSFLKDNTFQLIEAATEHLAEAVLLAFARVQEIQLEIQKPQAPIGLPVAYVSVQVRRGWKQAYLGIGSNMGDKERFIEEAVSSIKRNAKIREVSVSKLITTEPYGGIEQENFLNGVIALKTLLTPWELLDFLHELEGNAGRERKIHWGPRTLDLDILYYEGFMSFDRQLTVPHPDMSNRSFVLEPLRELAPFYQDPVTGRSIEEMINNLKHKNREDTCQ